MNYVFRYQLIRLLFFVIPSAETRSKLLKKHHYFYEMGENVHFQPRVLPADPKFIKLHNNIAVASNVSFVTHDIIHKVLNHLPNQDVKYKSHLGCIEVMDNVFIGSGTRIMPNVRIGSNTVIASGSVVTKDLPEGGVWAGSPAKRIGDFYELVRARAEESKNLTVIEREKRIGPEWEKFYTSRSKEKESNRNEG